MTTNDSEREPRARDFLSPTGIISAARKSHPAFRYAIAAAGLASLVAVVVNFGISATTLVFGTIVLVVVMVLFLVFAQASVVSSAKMALPASVLVWSFLILAILVAVFLASSTFFNSPLPIKELIIRQLNEDLNGGDRIMQDESWPEKPTLLFITPEDIEYGELHEKGLRAALTGSGILVRSCYSRIAKSSDKFGYDLLDLRRIRDCIADALESGNIIAVVGPCLMTITHEIVETIVSNNPDVPVILESPVTRAVLGNNTGVAYGPLKPPLPIYRISSGIDERTPHISNLIYILIHEQARVAVLLEDVPYAQALMEGVISNLEDKRNFRSGQPPLTRLGRDQELTDIESIFDADFVSYFGSGSRYIDIAIAQMNSETNPYFIGFMNAWAFNIAFAHPQLFEKLIDLEDIEALSEDTPRNSDQLDFERRFGEIGPDVRDLAFSHDAGLCIKRAWYHANQMRARGEADKNCLEWMREYFERDQGHECVTGRVDFAKGGGQNVNLEKRFLLHKTIINENKLMWETRTVNKMVDEWRQEKERKQE